MSTIPSGQKFKTVDASVDTVEKQSSRLNSYGETYTMQDITDTVTAGISTDADPQVAVNTADIATNVFAANATNVAFSGAISANVAAIAAIPTSGPREFIVNCHNDNNNVAVNRVWGIGLTTASDRLYGYGRLILPFDCQLKSIRFNTEFQAGVYGLQVGDGSVINDNTSVSAMVIGDTAHATYKAHVTGDMNQSVQKDRKAFHEFTGVNFLAGENMFILFNSVLASGQTPVTMIFEAV